jgi:peptidoglycan/xylan/chitin deacetylase (PgdA/CDA1 family)
MPALFLTFDTEDFVNKNVIPVLHRILESLKKYDLTALFFITGHMAEKLYDFPSIVDLLNAHQIGYHTSSHSVHPAIFEFTDIEDYKEAYEISLKRETSHINPLTGNVEGRGGICALKKIFPKKQILAFRAPGNCWSPPHLEALQTLGISYDFSTNMSLKPVNYKGITFYPYPIIGHWRGSFSEYRLLLLSLRHGTSVLTVHPSQLVNKFEWDRMFWKSNPGSLSQTPTRNDSEIDSLFHRLNLLFRQINNLQKTRFIEITPTLKKLTQNLSPTRADAERCYQRSMVWPTKQNYKPEFLYQHFLKFFEVI